MINLFKIKNNQNGFTLVEMMVSLAIFTVVALIAVGSLLRVLDANKKSVNLKNAINNMNFTLDSLSREMRVGSKYSCSSDIHRAITSGYDPSDGDCIGGLTGDWLVYFTSSKVIGTCHPIYAYRYVMSRRILQKAQQDDSCSPINSTNYYDLTSESARINSSTLTVNNSAQPYANFVFNGESGTKIKDKVDFSIQTSVSQRIR